MRLRSSAEERRASLCSRVLSPALCSLQAPAFAPCLQRGRRRARARAPRAGTCTRGRSVRRRGALPGRRDRLRGGRVRRAGLRARARARARGHRGGRLGGRARRRRSTRQGQPGRRTRGVRRCGGGAGSGAAARPPASAVRGGAFGRGGPAGAHPARHLVDVVPAACSRGDLTPSEGACSGCSKALARALPRSPLATGLLSHSHQAARSWLLCPAGHEPSPLSALSRVCGSFP